MLRSEMCLVGGAWKNRSKTGLSAYTFRSATRHGRRMATAARMVMRADSVFQAISVRRLWTAMAD